MADTSTEIIIGVVSGVIASALIFAGARVFRSMILPTFRNLVYRGIDVSGAWHWKNRFGSIAKIELTQRADSISGIFTYVGHSKGGDIKIFTITGNIQDRFIQLNMKSADQKRLGVLSYIFEVVGDGNELRGSASFYATNMNRITSADESFYRTIDAAAAHAESDQEKFDQVVAMLNKSRSNQSKNDVGKAEVSRRVLEEPQAEMNKLIEAVDGKNDVQRL